MFPEEVGDNEGHWATQEVGDDGGHWATQEVGDDGGHWATQEVGDDGDTGLPRFVPNLGWYIVFLNVK